MRFLINCFYQAFIGQAKLTEERKANSYLTVEQLQAVLDDINEAVRKEHERKFSSYQALLFHVLIHTPMFSQCSVVSCLQ